MRRLLSLAGVAGFLVVWEAVYRFGVFNPILVTSPEAVAFGVLREITSADGLHSISLTLSRVVIGFGLGLLGGVALGLPIGYYAALSQALERLIDFFRSIPTASLFPLFLIFFGIGDAAKIASAVWGTGLVILVNTIYGVRNGNPTRRMVARIHHMRGPTYFMKVVLPDALPFIAAGARTAISICLIVVVVTEMFLGTTSGLGKAIYYAAMVYQTTQMYAYIVITGLLGYSLNLLFVMLEQRIVHWSGK